MTTKTKYTSTEDYISSPNHYEKVGRLNETKEENSVKKFIVNIDGFIGQPERTRVYAKNPKEAYATFVKYVLKSVMSDGVELIEIETEIVDEKSIHSVKSITKTLPNSNIFTIEDEGSFDTKVGEEMNNGHVPSRFIDTVYSNGEVA